MKLRLYGGKFARIQMLNKNHNDYKDQHLHTHKPHSVHVLPHQPLPEPHKNQPVWKGAGTEGPSLHIPNWENYQNNWMEWTSAEKWWTEYLLPAYFHKDTEYVWTIHAPSLLNKTSTGRRSWERCSALCVCSFFHSQDIELKCTFSWKQHIL